MRMLMEGVTGGGGRVGCSGVAPPSCQDSSTTRCSQTQFPTRPPANAYDMSWLDALSRIHYRTMCGYEACIHMR